MAVIKKKKICDFQLVLIQHGYERSATLPIRFTPGKARFYLLIRGWLEHRSRVVCCRMNSNTMPPSSAQ